VTAVREVLLLLARTKTSARAAARCATERRLLARWRAAGCDVPADLTDARRDLAGPRVAVFEFVPGRSLWDLLAEGGLTGEDRREVLRAFAASWGARHVLAVRESDADLVQEHGSIRHVLVSGGGTTGVPRRCVTIDLEQAFRPRADVRPLIAKEIAGYLRSLLKRAGEDRFREDLRTIVAAYPDRTVLAAACAEYLRSPSPFRRALWSLDRRFGGKRAARQKYGPLEDLEAILREASFPEHTAPAD
jgi:hypothetical protein